MALDFSQWVNQVNGDAGGSPSSYGDWGSYSQPNYAPMNWSDFVNSYNQVAQANQMMQWQDAQQEDTSPWSRDDRDEPRRYRQMTDLEKFSAGAAGASDFISNALGNWLFGTPDNPETGEVGQQGVFGKPSAGEDIGAIKLENAPRMLANIPGMFIGSIPDLAAYGTELAANAPAMQGDLETGLIEDRSLTDQERFGDIGYMALGGLSMIPGIGVEAKGAGLGLKGLSKVAGRSAAGEALSDAGNIALKGGKSSVGAIERIGTHSGKTGAELNPYRWGDAAMSALGSAATEAVQEGGQTAFEDIRYNRFDLSDPNETQKRVAEGAFWGGLAGGIVGGAPNIAGTAITNSRAKNGLDRNGNPVPQQTPQPQGTNFYQFWDNKTDQSGFRITPEMQQLMLEQEGDQKNLQHVGSSMKGVAGFYGQNPNVIYYGTRGLRRQYERIADDEVQLKELAESFGLDENSFSELMEKSDQEIVDTLNPVIDALYKDKDKKNRMVLSTTRAPSTKYGSHQTYFVRGLTAGNTVSFAPGNPTAFGGDLDGDNYSLFQDKEMSSWDHLPTRKLMGPKNLPANNSGGLQNIPYGSVEYGFSESGITPSLANRKVNSEFVKALDATIAEHHIYGDDLKALRNSILDSFDVSEDESANGITWKHKLAKTLSDTVTKQNAERTNPQTKQKYRINLAGDDLVADIISTMSREGSVLAAIDNAVDSVNANDPNFMPELEATYENIPTTKGAMPEGKVNLMQILVWFGKLNSELSTKDSPMFRFKQMTAWNAKFRQMSQDLLDNLGIDLSNDSNAVDKHIKWCMQMINNMHLPIDYIDTAFKAKVMLETEAALRVDGTNTSMKFGGGLEFDAVKSAFTEVWNRNADLFDKAVEGQYTTKGEESIKLSFHKNRIVQGQNEDQSFMRNFMDVFGSWDVSQIARIDSNSFANNYTLAGLFEVMAESPNNFDTSIFDYVGGDFGKLVRLGVSEYQGKQYAQVSNVNGVLNQCSSMKAEFTVDEKTGVVSWDPEHNLEVSFWVGAIQNLLGLKASQYLAVWGTDYLAHSGWGRFLINRDVNVVKRGLVAAGIRYNWREYIDAVEDPRCTEVHQKAALARIDMSNPLNKWILARMYAAGEKETGKREVLSNEPLMQLVDPTDSTYDVLSDRFDHNSVTHVRGNSDMLLYYALDDGTSTIAGSEISTRSRTAKNYVNAMNNNAMARAREYLNEVKSLVSGFHQISESDIVKTIKALATSHPNVVNPDTYAVAIHDAGFASGRAAEKAKASRGASMHYDSATQFLGGYSASFLKQLGVSVGNIDAESAFDVADAVRQAVFDPKYRQKVTIDSEGHMIEISQENLFKAVDPAFKAGDEVTYKELMMLFDQAPQLLGQLMPHTYEPLSADAETVAAVMLDTPANTIKEYINGSNGPNGASYRAGVESKKVRNHILADQDSTLLVFGSLDSRYDQLVADTAGWTREVNRAADEWSDFIYRVACVENDVVRQNIIERNFGTTGLSIGRRTKDALNDLMDVVRDKEHSQMEANASKRSSDRLRETVFLKNLEARVAKDGLNKKYREQTTRQSRKGIAQEETLRRQERYNISIGLTEAYLQYEVGSRVNLLEGEVGQDVIDFARQELERYVDDNTGQRIYSDNDIDNIINEIMKVDSVLPARKKAKASIISRGEMQTSDAGNAKYVIGKVEKFWRSRDYKRLSSEYFKDDKSFNKWREDVVKAYTWSSVGTDAKGNPVDADGWTKAKRDEWLADQVSFWNREILSSSLQKTYDTYGAGTASNELSMLQDARDFVTNMVNEVVCDNSISKIGVVDPNSITMPRITYQNKATSPHIAAASIELESGGAPIMSGQNAGSYQYMTVLDFVEKDFSCPADLRVGLTRDEAIALAEGQVDPLNYVLDDGTIATVTADNLRYAQRYWTDDVIKATRFASQRDCLCGAACHHHNPLPVTQTAGTYIGGRYTIASLCWYLSERRVFKSKKRRRVFDKVSHIVNEASDLKSTEFNFTDRQTLLTNVQDYQERLAEHIMKVLLDEHMEDEFGIGDARIIAQFMTPALEVVYERDGLHRDTISKWSLANDESFAAELKGDGTVDSIGVDEIVSVKPIAMSITDVCKKLTSDLLKKVDTDERYTEGKTPKRGDLSNYVSEGMSTWRGKIVDSDKMLDFLKNQPVARRSMGRSLLYGSSPNVMQNFMDFGGSMQVASSYSKTSLINNAITSNPDDRDTVNQFNRALSIDTSTLATDGRPVVVVKYASSNNIGTATPRETSQAGRFAALRLKDDNFAVPHVYNAIVIPSFTNLDDPGALQGYWEEAERKRRVLLVPESSQSDFISALSANIGSRKINESMLDGDMTINGEPFVVYDPWKSKSFIDNDMPQSYLMGFDPMEMFLSYQDRGMLATSDSGSKVTPRVSKLAMRFDTSMEFSKDVLVGNKPELKSNPMYTIDLDALDASGKTYRQILKEEVSDRLAGKTADTNNGPFRIVLPKFDDTYKIADSIVLKKIEAYLSKNDDALYSDGTVVGEVMENDCMNILATKVGSETYYIPLIYNRGGGPVKLDSVYLDEAALRTGTVSMRWVGKMTASEAEGLKNIYPTIAYKTYSTVMTPEDEQRMIHSGINITIVSNGQRYDFETSMMYSGDTEDSRLIDAGYQVKLENLGNLGKILPRHFFMKLDPQTNQWVTDYDKFNGLLTPQQVDRLCEWNSKAAWWDFVYDPSMRLSDDPEVNAIFRKVARAALSAGLNPLYAFANIYYNGKIRYIDFNHNLVYGVLTDNELERFFYAMDPRFCFDGTKESSSYTNRQAPYVDRNGWLLGSDSKYHPGHIHFIRPTDDSSMLGVPSGRVKFGVQQVLNESLIEGISHGPKGRGDISTLIEYARAKQGDPSNYIYGGKYADAWFKNKSDKEIHEMADRYSYDDLNIDKYLRRSRTPSNKARSRRAKMLREFNANLNKRISFTSKDGSGSADMSDLSDERQMYDTAVNRFREAFRSDDPNSVPLQNYEIERMYKETTASTYNDGKGTYRITVKDFADWCNAVVDRLEHGEFPFEVERSISGRPIIGAVSSGLLDRLMMSPRFRSFDGHEWTRDEFVDLMFGFDEDSGKMGTIPKLMESLNFATVPQRESLYTMIDIISGTYGRPEMSRPIGDYGLHLSDLVENSDPLYDTIGDMDEYPGLYERRQKTTNMIKRAQDNERRRNYKQVPTYSSETGYMGQVRRKPNGLVWDTLSAVSRVMSTINLALPVSAVVQRYITQGQNRVYIWLDNNITRGVFTDNTNGIVIKNREAVAALGDNPHVQEIWVALNTMSWSGEDLIALQNVNTWEDLHNLIESRKRRMGWAGKVQNRMFEWASGGHVGVSWQIRNWADRLASKITEEEMPELTEVVDAYGTTRYEQMLIDNPENFALDFLSTRDSNPYFIEANQARNWVVDREHAGQSMFGLALSHAFETHPIGRFMFVTGLCKFPHYAYNIGGWFLNHFAPVSTVAYIARSIAINMANNGTGKLSQYLASLDLERTQVHNSIKEAMLNDSLMMGSTALTGMLFGLGWFEPPDDEYYDEYAGRPEEWTIAGFRVKENWWLMDILGPFAAVAATWKSIEIGKPRLDLLQNWMTEALWSNPIVKASDIAKTMLDPTEQYMEQYDNIVNQYKEAEDGPPSALKMFLDDGTTYGLNWFSQFITPSIIREISQSREFMEHERSYKLVKNEEGELVETDYLDSRIRKATRNNLVLGLLVDGITAVTGRSSQSGYIAREMPEVRIPDQNQKDTMQYFSLYNDDGSEKTENEKQVLAMQVLCVLHSSDNMDKLYKDGFVIPMETRIYASQMLNDIKQYETDQYNAWVQATGMDAYLLGQGDFTEGMRIANETKAAYKDDLKQISKLFDKLWSDEMNRGLQMYYRLPTTYAKTTSGEWYATGFSRSINPLQSVVLPFILGETENNMGREGNWETESAVIEGKSAGGRNLVPIDPDKIKRPKLSDFASDENNGYSDTKAGKEYANASFGLDSAAKDAAKSLKSTSKTPSSSGSGFRYGGGGGGGGGGSRGYGGSAPNFNAPSVNLPNANPSRIMNTDRLVNPDLAYLRPDFETKGSREAYRRSDI